MKSIYIIHENDEWLVPLREAFKKLDVEAIEVFLDEGAVNFDQQPPDGIYYNRMSASSHTRGHRFAPELTRMYLTWLEMHGCTVINGTEALYLEVCKISQYAAMEKAGIKTPLTRAIVGEQTILECAKDFNQWPLIVKPNRGGKGLGVQKFDDGEQLEQYLLNNSLEKPLDGIWLLQEYIKPQFGFITRCEFVGGKFMYAVNVDAGDGFELCPADGCVIDDSFCPAEASGETNRSEEKDKFIITKKFDAHSVIGNFERFISQKNIKIAGIEFIETEAGEIIAYDVNTNTNYNSSAEQKAAIEPGGMQSIANYLAHLSQSV